MTIKVLIPSGALGLNYNKEALQTGLKQKPDIIAIDGGSTDSGPSYLGEGVSKYSRTSTKAEWKGLMEARAEANIPLLIGTAGTCGTDSSVDWFLNITNEVAKELSQSLKIVVIKCSQDNKTVSDAYLSGKIKPLPNAPDLSSEIISNCKNIVALAGVEQIIDALREKPDIIIAGRTTDTAIIAALPIMMGVDPGIAWHGAKIAECGALCTTNPLSGVIIVEFENDSFAIEPMSKDARATPKTVSAHMLYENTNPYILYEPGGYLDAQNATYKAENDRKVRVYGSKWNIAPKYTVKIEGAALTGFQNVIITLLRDKRYVKNAEIWTADIKLKCSELIRERLYLDKEDFSIEFRLIGQNASFGDLEPQKTELFEVGVMALVTSQTQIITTEIAQMLNPFLLHHPLNSNEELPTFSFPFSPADIMRGPIYNFCLHHVWELDNPLKIFSKEIIKIG
jgi:hypothetical protein